MSAWQDEFNDVLNNDVFESNAPKLTTDETSQATQFKLHKGVIVVIKIMSFAAALMVTGMLIAIRPAMSAEITEEMRTFARMFTSLEARDLKGYCTAMHGAQYAGYLGRVCQSAVQNKVKKPEECSGDSIAQQVKADAAKCLAMPPEEFDKAVARGAEGRKAFLQRAASQGVDGEKLLKDERAKRR